MPMRWIILLVLFFARTVMALQFQSVAALSPFLLESLAITLTDIGVLIGVFLGPGIVVAVAGGAVATWVGDKRTVIASLVLMLVGGIIIGSATTLGWALLGRVVAGIGGVVINVLMTKLVLDWFIGRNVSTALAIFISSWPVGIALGLVLLPALATSGGLGLAWNVVNSLIVLTLLLFALVYRPPEGAQPAAATIKMTALPWTPLVFAAVVWSLYNAAFVMIFAFGTLVLVDRGFDTTAASWAISSYIIAATISIPLGGWVADRTGRSFLVVFASLMAGVVMLPALLFVPGYYVVPLLIMGGLIAGLAPGPVVAMPGQILQPEARAFGTGVFYSIYYALMMIAPPLAGVIADLTDDVSTAFPFGAVMLIIAILALLGFQRTKRPISSA